MVTENPETRIALMTRNKYCIDIILLILKLRIARGPDLIDFLCQSYHIHRSSGYRNIALFVKEGILDTTNYSKKCTYYRVPHQVKVLVLRYLRFQRKVRIEETSTSLVHRYQGKFVYYKMKTSKMITKTIPKVLLEPNL